ncbi:uncharacterized protein LOC132635929 isoform X2 [Lycium barbarum]|uniref:uncharacterized protein LOC132635929 isoform X2 n=1 Tax=Lycium barbarum TaxID=112863 RepID=UPI00293EDBC0|nr:uncharacterized protein LOC132635929 isoform X2 [Lycium barbarum]
MGDYRSKSYADGRMQIEKYYEPQFSSNNLKSYSVSSYASTVGAPPLPPPTQLKKGKSTSGSTSKSWSFNDPEFQRKRRVASYKVYSVEGKVKGSLRRSFRWFKDKYTQVLYGWRHIQLFSTIFTRNISRLRHFILSAGMPFSNLEIKFF